MKRLTFICKARGWGWGLGTREWKEQFPLIAFSMQSNQRNGRVRKYIFLSGRQTHFFHPIGSSMRENKRWRWKRESNHFSYLSAPMPTFFTKGNWTLSEKVSFGGFIPRCKIYSKAALIRIIPKLIAFYFSLLDVNSFVFR